ncbi:MAG TPA: hypothetical protein VK949_02165 [Methylotenera sp.]|nr:hypothetical protein [Methylotenera sp.]
MFGKKEGNSKQVNWPPKFTKQSGATLIIMLIILALSATIYAIKTFNASAIQLQRDKSIAITLAEAKSALIGYSFGRVGSGERPGNMPYPDRLLSPIETPPAGGPPNYDGQSDSCNGIAASMVCLGRLPWQTIGLAIKNPTQNDVVGQMPWYAVSANLTDPTCMNNINPDILNMSYTTYVCGSNTNLPHPWLTVRDSKGNIISNRVAIVLILPGETIGSQVRPLLPLGGASNYLDTAIVPSGCNAPCIAGSYSNADLDNDFIMASGLSGTNLDQNNQNFSSTLNDKILFITIDELVYDLTKRAAGEARTLLSNYKTKVGSFPYAAPLGASLDNNKSSGTHTTGSLPIDVTDTCNCTLLSGCTCSFNVISSVAFKRTTGSWTGNTLSCSRSGTTCTCTNAGTCTRATETFSCNALGVCSNNVIGINTYTFTVPNYADIFSSNSECSISGGKAVCTGAISPTGSFEIGLKEPNWFKDNLWQDFFFYHQSSISNLQIGTDSGISALIIGTGPIISGQIRPSNLVENYLDSAENRNGDNVYDAIGTTRTTNYNDQSFVIAH